MKRIVLIIFVLALVAITSNAQTIEFNHKGGEYIKVDGANNYYWRNVEFIRCRTYGTNSERYNV